MPHKARCHLTKCDVINDVKLFPTVYHRIYCRKFLTLTNQTLRYKKSALECNFNIKSHNSVVFWFDSLRPSQQLWFCGESQFI